SPPLEPGIADIGFAEVKFGGGGANRGAYGNMVLDVADEGVTSYDGTSLPLVIRRINPNRVRTQTWKFTEDGRLRCSKYEHLFIAPRGTDSSLSSMFRSGNPACLTLGPMEIS